MKKLLVLFGAMALVMLGFSGPAAAFDELPDAKNVKVDVCHVNGQGEFNLINISENAFPKHVDHGDVSPGDAIVSMPGYQFGADCQPEEIPFTGVCPDELIPGYRLGSDSSPAFSGVSEITMEATFTNQWPGVSGSGEAITFPNTTSGNSFQMWTRDPTGYTIITNNSAVTVNAEPSGIVQPGEAFTYDLTIDVAALAASGSIDERIGIRPHSDEAGYMDRIWAPVVGATFTCS